MKLRGQ